MTSQYLEQLLDEEDEDLITEFTNEEFLAQLQRYTKVRDSNYQAPTNARIADDTQV